MAIVVKVRLAIKILEWIICMVCIGLHTHSSFKAYSGSIFLSIVYGGYIIILAGLILGFATKERVPKKVDLLYTFAALPLFIAAGSIGVHNYHANDNFYIHHVTINTGLACGSLGIINGGFFLVDGILGLLDHSDLTH